jgi:hypothetical protein
LKADTNSVYLKTLLYTKTETDTLLNDKINLNTVYTIAQENTLLANKLDITTFNTAIALKANTADFYGKTSLYTKTETDTLLNNKLNSSLITSYYTKTEITNIFINYYTKLYIDNSFYIKTEVDALLDNIRTMLNFKAMVADIVILDDKINLKADSLTTYTKTQIDNILLLKANAASFYTGTNKRLFIE